MSMIFGAASTTDEVLAGVDLRGKRALVTGVSAGLGIETARALAAHGAHVIGMARDLDKATRALAPIRAEVDAKGGAIALLKGDLADLKSVRAAADALLSDGESFDLVIANAGVLAMSLRRTADDFEMQFGTNHLGHFALVNRIASLIREGGRLVSLSSSGHRFCDVDLNDPNFEQTPYDPYVAYGRSKTANILFAVEFDRRHKGRGVRAAAVHPGAIMTELTRDQGEEQFQAALEAVKVGSDGQRFTWKTLSQGAATSVWVGVVARADEVGGRYCENCHVTTLVSDLLVPDMSEGVRPYALDPENAKALWAKSEEMIGEVF